MFIALSRIGGHQRRTGPQPQADRPGNYSPRTPVVG
jgi:hypothetical protein